MKGKAKPESKTDIKKLLFNFSALLDLSEETTSVKDFKGIMKSSLYLLMGSLPITKGAILEFNYRNHMLRVSASKGLEEELDGFGFSIDKQTAVKIKNEEEIIKFHKKNILFKNNLENWEKLKAKLIVPMVVKNELIGIITLGEKFSKEAYSQEDFTLISITARHIGVSIHNCQLMKNLAKKAEENKKLFEELQSIYYDTIQALAAAIDAKDPYTRGHSYRVSNYCEAIGKELKFSKRELEGIKIAGFLHDIGKIAIDKNIINKPACLNKEEYGEIYQHPMLSYEILSRIRFPWKNIPVSVLYHHERVDGKGYPDNLTSVEIPKMAKVMAIADAFDAMTTDRPYKNKLSLDEAIVEIRNQIGKQFDPQVAKGLFGFIKNDINGGKNRPGLLNWVNFNFNPGTTNQILNKIISELSHLEEMYPSSTS